MKPPSLFQNRVLTTMAITTTEPAFLRLLQLASVSLPVGGFSFSQGMEYAVDNGWLRNQAAVGNWLGLQLRDSLARLDIPVLQRVYEAADEGNETIIREWNEFLIASRETHELRLADLAMGQALQRLLPSLSVPTPFSKKEDISFVTAFAIAAQYWQCSFDASALAFSWSWLENQVAAATKLVPLGQTQAQQLLTEIQQEIPVAVAIGKTLENDDLGAALPALAIASALHETQYSRLFRS